MREDGLHNYLHGERVTEEITFEIFQIIAVTTMMLSISC